MNSKPPTIPFGVVACTLSDNLSWNSCILLFHSDHLKWDQNQQFTALGKTTSGAWNKSLESDSWHLSNSSFDYKVYTRQFERRISEQIIKSHCHIGLFSTRYYLFISLLLFVGSLPRSLPGLWVSWCIHSMFLHLSGREWWPVCSIKGKTVSLLVDFLLNITERRL